MGRLFVLFVVLCFALFGCAQEKVVNNHNDIKNIEGLDNFFEKVENQSEAKITYIRYGIEGQEGVTTLTFDGERLHVSFSVDGKFIHEYNCQGAKIEIEKDRKNYILSECSGDFNGDAELLSIPNN